jgi:hypothetical protein
VALLFDNKGDLIAVDCLTTVAKYLKPQVCPAFPSLPEAVEHIFFIFHKENKQICLLLFTRNEKKFSDQPQKPVSEPDAPPTFHFPLVGFPLIFDIQANLR